MCLLEQGCSVLTISNCLWKIWTSGIPLSIKISIYIFFHAIHFYCPGDTPTDFVFNYIALHMTNQKKKYLKQSKTQTKQANKYFYFPHCKSPFSLLSINYFPKHLYFLNPSRKMVIGLAHSHHLKYLWKIPLFTFFVHHRNEQKCCPVAYKPQQLSKGSPSVLI